MPVIDVKLEGDSAWIDLPTLKRRGKLIELNENIPIEMAPVEQKMTSGRHYVKIRFELPDGRVAIARTSLRALWESVHQIALHCGELQKL